MDNKTFIQSIFLIETVIQKSFSKDQLVVYKQLLDDIPEFKFVAGINKLLKERVYTNFPSPAEIREYCLGNDKDIEYKAVKAGAMIREALRDFRSGRVKRIFEDPVIHHVIKNLGGFETLGKKYEEDLEKLISFEVPKLYKMFYKENLTIIPELISGYFEYGESEEPIVLEFGNHEKIVQWQSEYKQIEIENKKSPKAEVIFIE
ncbi:MAG: hypothetical protein ACRCZ2_05780 [Fusobacteriaceae bacterium]